MTRYYYVPAADELPCGVRKPATFGHRPPSGVTRRRATAFRRRAVADHSRNTGPNTARIPARGPAERPSSAAERHRCRSGWLKTSAERRRIRRAGRLSARLSDDPPAAESETVAALQFGSSLSS